MILIASHSKDRVVIQPVVDLLQKQGEDVLVYLADKVATGEVRAGIVVDHEARSTFFYGDREFFPEDVEAAWYRRPNVFGPQELNEAHLIYLDGQRKACQDALWFSIPAERWLNSPTILDSLVEDKIVQLYVAHEVGFRVPRSVISNDWNLAYQSFGNPEVIVKLPNGRMFFNKKPHHMVTTVIDQKKYKAIAKTVPFPGIWQEFIPKKKEWRITVIGDKVFPASIYTSKKARADWRKHQFDGRTVKFKAERPPLEIEKLCVKMLKRLNTHFGAFDLIEQEDGTFIFLEVNLNGSYHWLVNKFGLPMPEAIAEELLKIKKQHKAIKE